MANSDDVFKLEGAVDRELVEFVSRHLSPTRPFAGLRWSPNMPDDDPDADLLVIDSEGTEYVLEIVTELTPLDLFARRRDGDVAVTKKA